MGFQPEVRSLHDSRIRRASPPRRLTSLPGTRRPGGGPRARGCGRHSVAAAGHHPIGDGRVLRREWVHLLRNEFGETPGSMKRWLCHLILASGDSQHLRSAKLQVLHFAAVVLPHLAAYLPVAQSSEEQFKVGCPSAAASPSSEDLSTLQVPRSIMPLLLGCLPDSCLILMLSIGSQSLPQSPGSTARSRSSEPRTPTSPAS